MYKLDREFDCFVRKPPRYSIITKSVRGPSVDPFSPGKRGEYTEFESPRAEHKNHHSKRKLPGATSFRRLSRSNSGGKRKKRRPIPSGFSSSSSSSSSDEGQDVDEAHRMAVDDPPAPPKKYKVSERLKRVRANKEEARKRRRQYLSAKLAKLGRTSVTPPTHEENAFPDPYNTSTEEEKDGPRRNESYMSWIETPSPDTRSVPLSKIPTEMKMSWMPTPTPPPPPPQQQQGQQQQQQQQYQQQQQQQAPVPDPPEESIPGPAPKRKFLSFIEIIRTRFTKH